LASAVLGSALLLVGYGLRRRERLSVASKHRV
jgi:hypothetical protein